MIYPHGAIETREAVQFLIAKRTPLFVVHGLGKDSFMSDLGNGRYIEDKYLEYSKVSIATLHTTGNGWMNDHICLGDVNIGGHHNEHFLFHEKEDAEAYLKWAKDNTKDMGRL